METNETVVLHGKQLLFAENFLKLKFNGMQAAIAAGYNGKNPGVSASVLLNNSKVHAYIEKRKAQLLEEIGVNQFRVLRELAAIAFADARDFYEDGVLKNVDKLSDEAAAALMCVDVFELFNSDGSKIGETKRARFHDKLKALELLGRYLNLFQKDNESSKPELNVFEVTLNLK